MISGNDPRRHPCIPTRSDNERKCFQNYSSPSEEEKCCCAAKPGANSGLCPHLKALQMNTQTGQRLKGLRAASTGFRPWDKSQTSNSSWKSRRNPETLKRGPSTLDVLRYQRRYLKESPEENIFFLDPAKWTDGSLFSGTDILRQSRNHSKFYFHPHGIINVGKDP